MLHLLEDAECISLRGAWIPAGLHGQERLLLDDDRALKLMTPEGQLLVITLPDYRLPQGCPVHMSVCGQLRRVCNIGNRRCAACILHCPSEELFEPISSMSWPKGQWRDLLWPACGSYMVLSGGSSYEHHIQEPPFKVLTFI